MRVAVGLPSLEPAAPQRIALDAMFGALAARGHTVEGFAEHDRTSDVLPFPVFHYLRVAERHREQPFDAALWPIGRDATPYQGVFVAMRRHPGIAWVLDPVLHHLAVGGVALMEDWAGYRRMLDAAYPDRSGALAQTVANNWGTGALFRRYDLVDGVLDGQPRVFAAWEALGRRCAAVRDGASTTIVPLGLDNHALLPTAAARADDDAVGADDATSRTDVAVGVGHAAAPTAGEGDPGPPRRVAIMTVNESYATSALKAAAAILEAHEDARVTLCLSEPIYKAEGKHVSEQLGVKDRIDWQLTTSPRKLADIAARHDLLLWLAEELQAGHRLLMRQTLAAGKLTVVADAELYDDIPDGAVAKVELGRGLGSGCAALMAAMRDDVDLRRAMVRHGRAYAAEQPHVAAAVDVLETELARAAAVPAEAPTSASTWERLDGQLADAVIPAGTDSELAERMLQLVRRRVEELRR